MKTFIHILFAISFFSCVPSSQDIFEINPQDFRYYDKLELLLEGNVLAKSNGQFKKLLFI